MPETLSSSSTTGPWSTQEPYLTRGFQAAQNLYLRPSTTPGAVSGTYEPRPLEWYTDPNTGSRSTVSPLTQQTRNLIGDITDLATGRSILNPAERYARNVMRGNYLSEDTNPYLADMVTAASQSARDQFLTQEIPGLSSRFGMSGRSGSPGMSGAFENLSAGYGRGIADIATNLYGTAYENERQRQQEMAMFAPDLLQARVGLYSSGLDAQDILNEQRQRMLTDRVNRFNFEQKAPSEALDRFLRSVSGSFGSTSTSSEQVFQPEQWTQILGGLGTLASSGLLGNILGAGGDFVDWLGGLF